MVERNELITMCRQIGGMMEAGVDILRITRVLRAQTDNPRLLQLLDALDHDMTMGHGLADAMSHAPDVFSPFMVLMVQQGEARNDLAGSFFKIAEYIQKDGELAPDSPAHDAVLQDSILPVQDNAMTEDRVLGSRMNAPTAPLTVIALDGLIDRLQTFALRSLTVISGLLLSLAGVWWSVEMGWLERRWSYPTVFSVAAIFMGTSGIVIQRRIKAERRREARCSFCGRAGTEGDALQRAPRFAGAAICSRCAHIAAQQTEAKEERENAERENARAESKTVNVGSTDAMSSASSSAMEKTLKGDLPRESGETAASTTAHAASTIGSGAKTNRHDANASSTRNGVAQQPALAHQPPIAPTMRDDTGEEDFE